MNMDHQMGMPSHNPVVESESSLKEYSKFILLILAITLVSLFFASKYGSPGFMEYMRWFMGVFFAVFAFFKFIGYKMFALMFAGYDIVAKRVRLYAYAYPFIELGLAILYLGDLLPTSRDVIT